MLEELLDDQEDIGDINLSSRPVREERRRQRDREALEREVVCRSSLVSQTAPQSFPDEALLLCTTSRLHRAATAALQPCS